MSELTNSKTWNKNRVTSTGASTIIANKNLLIAIKNQMITSGWDFVSSSNAINWGGLDHWVYDTDIVIADEGVAHSWIVLQNDNIKSGFQICLNMVVSDTYAQKLKAYFSYVGFSGGTVSNKPTASDETQISIYFDTWFSSSLSTSVSANIFTSSDLECTHIFLYNGTALSGCFIFDVPKNYPSWFTNKSICMISNSCSFVNYDISTESVATAKVDQSRVSLCLGTLVIGSTYAINYNGVADAFGDVGTDWPCTPIWLLSSQVAFPGQFGVIYDLWWSHTTSVTTGDYFPYDGSMNQVVFGNMIQGNDGTAVTL